MNNLIINFNNFDFDIKITQLIEQAFQEFFKLPDIQQNMIARWLLDDIVS